MEIVEGHAGIVEKPARLVADFVIMLGQLNGDKIKNPIFQLTQK